jgi:polyhydroxybutyrate depolymerase
MAGLPCGVGWAQPKGAAGGLERRTWTVDGVEREALVYFPSAAGGKSEPTTRGAGAPLIFAWHGHGGSMRNASRWDYEKYWPEAIVVYPQGLPTKGMTDPQGTKAGWQQKVGDYEDRDLKFFDAMLAELKKDYPVDDKRIFSTGHSNGGKMTYLLWEARGKEFAAFAPSAAPAGITIRSYVPKPLFHIGSPEDPIVKFTWQKASIDAAIKLDACDPTSTKWEDECDWYASKSGTPVVTLIHHGGHVVPKEGPELEVKFFKKVTEGRG